MIWCCRATTVTLNQRHRGEGKAHALESFSTHLNVSHFPHLIWKVFSIIKLVSMRFTTQSSVEE